MSFPHFKKFIIHIDLIDKSNIIFNFFYLDSCCLSSFSIFFLIYLSVNSPSQFSLQFKCHLAECPSFRSHKSCIMLSKTSMHRINKQESCRSSHLISKTNDILSIILVHLVYICLSTQVVIYSSNRKIKLNKYLNCPTQFLILMKCERKTSRWYLS